MAYFISIDGGEFTGKTTVVVPSLAEIFTRAGFVVKTGRDPGGTKAAEKLRVEIFRKSRQGADPKELALLFYKARKFHVDQVIAPFLKTHSNKKAIMIMDRYLDSTRVYQGLEAGVSMDYIRKLEDQFVGPVVPDLFIILYIRSQRFFDVIARRKASLSQKDKSQIAAWDLHDLDKHFKRQKLYLTLPKLSIQLGENRIYRKIEVSRKPCEILSDCVKALTPLVESDASYKQLCSIVKQLQKEKYWKALDDSI
ncbi:MAG: dTMP kinase [Candidatus Paceibacterota bacterium]